MYEHLEFEISDGDRRYLREAIARPGYAVMLRIMDSYVDALREGAIAQSEHDPLVNRDAIAQRWAYASIAKQIRQQLEAGIQFELKILEDRTAPPPDPRAVSEARRRAIILGDLNPPA